MFPDTSRYRLASYTLALTLIIEFGQLWQPAALQWLRSQPIIGFLLGNSFLWSDVACLLVGTFLALLIDTAISTCLRKA